MAIEWLIHASIGGVSSFGATGIIAHTLLQYAEVSDGALNLPILREANGYDGS